MFSVIFSSHGERAFGKLSQEDRARIIHVLEDLVSDQLWYRRVKKLQGSEDRYRLRMGRWRVLFMLQDGEIVIMDIFLKKGPEDYHRRGL